MSFVTKLDYSDNRQIKQFQLTNTKLSGTTEFGLDVNDLGGVNESTVYQTGTLVNITSTFSGNSSTTIFWFGDSSMIPAASSLYAITNLTSGDTQTARGFEGVGPTIVDGNNIYSGYTGSTYDLIVTAITETGVNEWTGETYSSNVAILSGASADFTGRAIWVDVLGVTRTKRLILADKPDSLTGVTTVLTRDEFGDIYEVEFSAVTNDNYISGATFSASTGDLLLINTSGETITTNLDGRYLPLSATTGDDYVTGSTYDSSTGLITFERLSGGTFTANIGITSGDTTNWDSAYNNIITGVTVTGTSNKTLTLTQRNGVTITTSFVDLTGGGAGETITGITFNTTNGDLILTTNSGSTIPTNLDGRYSLTGHTHDFSGLTNTGHTHVISEITDFPTNVSFFTNDVGYLTAYTNTDNYLTTHTFNTSTGLFESTLQSGGTVSVNLDGRYAFSSGHTHTVSDITDFPTDLSAFTNSVGYITGFTDTNDNDYVSSAGFDIGTGVLTLTRLSGGTVTVDLDDRYSLSGHTHPQYLTGYTDNNDYITSGSFNPANGEVTLTRVSGGTVVYNLDGRYSLTGHTHTVSEITDFPSVVSYFTNDVGYLTAYTDTNIFVSGGTFNSEILEFTNTSGGTFNIDLSNTYTLTGHTHTVSNITDFPTNISYFTNDVGYITGFTDTNDYVTSGVFDISTGNLTLTRVSGGTVVTNLDNRYSLTGHTHVGLSDDYVSSAGFDISTGVLTLTRISGGTVTVDLDDRYSLSGHTHTVSEITDFPIVISYFTNDVGYLTAYTDTNIFVSGGTFSSELLEFTNTSGGTFNIDLSNTYALTGHTHTISDITDYVVVDDYVTTASLNQSTGDLTLTRLSGDTVVTNLGFTSGDTTNWNSAYNDIITGATFTGLATKTLTLTQRDGNTITANFTDNSGGGAGETITGATFDTSTGDLDLNSNSGNTITTNLDGRYSLTGHTHVVADITDFPTDLSGFTNGPGYITGFTDTNDNIFVSGATFNTGDGVLEFTNTSGGTFNIDLDGRYLTGYTDNDDYVTSATFNAGTGDLTLSTLSGNTIIENLDGRYLTGYTETGNTDDYVTSGSFNTTNGEVTLTRVSGGTVVYDLDGRYSLTGHTHDFSTLTNTGHTHDFSEITNTGHTHTVSEITDFPTDLSAFTNSVGYITGFTDTNDYLTTHTFNTSTGLFESTLQSGGTVSVNLDGRYLPISAYTDNDTNIFVSGGTFNSEILEFTNTSGGTFNIDLSNTYSLTGHTHTISDITDYVVVDDYVNSAGFDIGTGVLTLTRLSGGTVTVDLDDRYSLSGHTHDFSELTNTGHTHTVSEITDFPINVSYFTNDVGYLTAYTDTNIFVSGATFNTGNGIIEFTNTSGGTFNVDIDNRYLLSSDYNPTDDYVTSGSFNTTNGVLTLTRLSGGTVTTNLDNRYSLTGHTHDLSGLTNTGHTHTVSEVTDFPTNVSFFTNDVGYLTGYTETGNTDDYVTGGTFNVTNGNLTLTRVSGGTVNVDLDGRYLLITGFTAPTGLEAIDEGNGIGWRLISRNSSNFGDIGLDAVDFSRSTSTSTTRGAVGDFSFAAGENNIVLSDRGTVFGSDNTLDLAASRGFVCGYQNTANNQYTFVANRKNLASGNASSAFGFSTVASGEESFAIGDDSIAAGTTSFCAGDGGTANGAYSSTLGGQLNNSNGDSSACLGVDNDAYSYGEFSIGIASTVYIPTSTIAWAATDRVFNVGNGVAFGVKSDAFTILKNGTITAPSLSNDIILTGDSKIIITKDYLNTYYSPTSGITNNNDYVTSGSFNPANGEVTLTRLSGGTVVYDLDGRYSLTGHTHPEFDNYLFLSGGTLTGPVTGTTFNVSDALLDYQENLDVLSAATEVVATVSKLTYDAVFFDYVVKKDSNLRAGIVMAVHDGTSVTYTDTSTADLGDTSGVVFTVNISGNDLRLVASVTTDNWIIKTLLRGI